MLAEPYEQKNSMESELLGLQKKIADLETKLNYGSSKGLLDNIQKQIVPKPLIVQDSAADEDDQVNQTSNTIYADQPGNGGSGESGGDFFKKRDAPQADKDKEYEKLKREEEYQGLMSNVELLGDDATMNVMGGIFGSYAAQNDNTEMDSRFYEKNMEKIRNDDHKIKLDIDMALPTNIQCTNVVLQESHFMPSDRDTHQSSPRLSDLEMDQLNSGRGGSRKRTLDIMKKEMEQAKRIIDKFQASTSKESQSLKGFSSKSALKKRPDSKMSQKRSEIKIDIRTKQRDLQNT